jgi:hypothetical protein
LHCQGKNKTYLKRSETLARVTNTPTHQPTQPFISVSEKAPKKKKKQMHPWSTLHQYIETLAFAKILARAFERNKARRTT